MLAARVEPKNGPGGGCRNRGQICRFALCRVSPICVTTDHVCALSGFTKSSVNGFVLVSVKVNGGKFAIPDALGDKIIHPYSDFLLHDIGTGDGIVQAGPQDTRLKLRTSPLWGLRMRPRFMHDLRSLSLQDAIKRHEGEADRVADQFFRLSPPERQQIITFLNSL